VNCPCVDRCQHGGSKIILVFNQQTKKTTIIFTCMQISSAIGGPTRSVAAKFEVTAYSKLAPAKISNLCIFEYTYVYSNIHGHFVDDYRIWTPFDSCPVNSKLWVSRIFEVMGFVTILISNMGTSVNQIFDIRWRRYP
jgi:hypothetical protein